MPNHVLAFAGSINSATLVNLPPVADPTFVLQNASTAYRLFHDYDVVATYLGGATTAQAQWNIASWNAINPSQLYPANLSASIPTNPQVADYRQYPMALPTNEDIKISLANSAGGAENDFALAFIMPRRARPYTPPAPAGPNGMTTPLRIVCPFTLTVTQTANVWSPDAAIAIAQTLRGGTYLIEGIELAILHGVAYRCNFPTAIYYQGDKLFPGGLCSAAYGNVPLRENPRWLGPLGFFDTNQYFQMSVFAATATGSTTFNGWMYLCWFGPQSMAGGGTALQQSLLSFGP